MLSNLKEVGHSPIESARNISQLLGALGFIPIVGPLKI
jgi:hypothetical protein